MVPGLAREQRMRAAHIEGKRDNEAFDRGDQHADPTKRTRIRHRRRLLQVLQPFREKISGAEFTKFVGNSGGIFGRLLTRKVTSSGTARFRGQPNGKIPGPVQPPKRTR
jgi:hypothetical protein